MRVSFPFPAMVGHRKLKTAYLANIINPEIGGLLISGPKGTGKSTVVYSVQDILPDFNAVKDCPFNCCTDKEAPLCSRCQESMTRDRRLPTEKRRSPVVSLPLSCTEDRLIGTIDVEALLKSGEKVIQPGILGEANNGILYIDEVNLLPDHIVDDILDVSASHWNNIEREGISYSHPSCFILVGTMNPEEGELRPQILDRFPLSVKLESITDIESRKEIIKRNILFETNPVKLQELFQDDIETYRQLILSARARLPQVIFSDYILATIAGACSALKVDGQRPDIVILKTSITITAMEQREAVKEEDVYLAAELTLGHRTRDGGLLPPATPEEIKEAFQKSFSEQSNNEKAFTDKSTMLDINATKGHDQLVQKKNPL